MALSLAKSSACDEQMSLPVSVSVSVGGGLNNAGIHTTGRKEREGKRERKVSRNEREGEEVKASGCHAVMMLAMGPLCSHIRRRLSGFECCTILKRTLNLQFCQQIPDVESCLFGALS